MKTAILIGDRSNYKEVICESTIGAVWGRSGKNRGWVPTIDSRQVENWARVYTIGHPFYLTKSGALREAKRQLKLGEYTYVK